jgi:hypothetical protein
MGSTSQSVVPDSLRGDGGSRHPELLSSCPRPFPARAKTALPRRSRGTEEDGCRAPPRTTSRSRRSPGALSNSANTRYFGRADIGPPFANWSAKQSVASLICRNSTTGDSRQATDSKKSKSQSQATVFKPIIATASRSRTSRRTRDGRTGRPIHVNLSKGRPWALLSNRPGLENRRVPVRAMRGPCHRGTVEETA